MATRGDQEDRAAREAAAHLADARHLTASKLGTVQYKPHPTDPRAVIMFLQTVEEREDGIFTIKERAFVVHLYAQRMRRPPPG